MKNRDTLIEQSLQILTDKQYLNQSSQAVKKECSHQKGQDEKRCEIQGGGQEMAVMVSLWQKI